MKLTARVQRGEQWWVVDVPEIDGLFTQAKRLDQVEDMVKDAAALLTDKDESEFEVELDIALPGTFAEHVELARQLAADAAAAQAKASQLTRLAVAELSQAELPLRDIGVILDVSFQRVGQLLKDFQSSGVAIESCRAAILPLADFAGERITAWKSFLELQTSESEGHIEFPADLLFHGHSKDPAREGHVSR
jgi:predicted RNase H-like HicB family nuclease